MINEALFLKMLTERMPYDFAWNFSNQSLQKILKARIENGIDILPRDAISLANKRVSKTSYELSLAMKSGLPYFIIQFPLLRNLNYFTSVPKGIKQIQQMSFQELCKRVFKIERSYEELKLLPDQREKNKQTLENVQTQFSILKGIYEIAARGVTPERIMKFLEKQNLPREAVVALKNKFGVPIDVTQMDLKV
ncbi:MAG: hypothetical protein ABFD50_15400 [Smithella sp.]